MQVFDASAVLAAIFEEPGGDRVAELWAEGENLISTVNYAEVVSKLAERGMPDADIHRVMEGVPLAVEAFDRDNAVQAGLLQRTTRSLGFSLGDRACLALARLRNAQAVTADRAWKKQKGIDIVFIR